VKMKKKFFISFVIFILLYLSNVILGGQYETKKIFSKDADFILLSLERGKMLLAAYFGRIRTLIPETSGQRFGIIRTA